MTSLNPNLEHILNWFSGPQREWLLDRSKHKVALKCRQVGYTEVSIAEAVYYCAVTPNHTFYLSKQRVTDAARELLGRARDRWIPAWQSVPELSEALQVVKDSTTEITFKNGSKLVAISNDPERMRGNVGSYLLDEVDFWELSKLNSLPDGLFPTIDNPLNPKCLLRIISTPYVEGRLFQQICASAKSKTGAYKDWSFHHINIYEAIEAGYPLDAEALKLRYAATPEKYLREYECKWVSTDYYYFNKEFLYTLVQPEYSVPQNCKTYVGIDVGKQNDFTAVTFIHKIANKQPQLPVRDSADVQPKRPDFITVGATYLIRRINYDIIAQVCAELVTSPSSGAQVESITVDGTNNLAFFDSLEIKVNQECDRLQKKRIPLRANHSSNTWKTESVHNLNKHFETGTISFPPEQYMYEYDNGFKPAGKHVLVEDLSAVIETQTPSGLPKFTTERTEDGHGDSFDALLLALDAAKANNVVVIF